MCVCVSDDRRQRPEFCLLNFPSSSSLQLHETSDRSRWAPILTGKDVHPPRLRTASSSNSVPIRDESARA